MQHMTDQILEHAGRRPEGAGIAPKALLHLGSRAAVDQALSRLVRRGKLLRAGRGLYVRPVKSRFGVRGPTVEQLLGAVTIQTGEVVAPNGAAAANALGFTTQVPIRSVYLTSGRSRKLTVGNQTVELRRAPRWQLALAGRPAGEAVRALAWLGPERAEAAMTALKRKLPPSALNELVAVVPQLPAWLARTISQAAAYA